MKPTLALLLALATPLAAQPKPFAIDPARIDAVFKDYGPTTPGCALGVYNKGKILYAKGYGMADLNLGVPITPATVFDIGSTSKQFAAASIVLLANEGKLSLSDDVRKYIPELPDYGKTITIDHMLRHTSGLRDYNGLLNLAGHYIEDYTDDDDALAVIVRQRHLNFDPGSRWDYSNTGFFLLSVIVKRVTGQTLADFAKERLLTPLGMPITHFRVDHTALLKNRATAYSPGAKGGYVIDMSDWDQAGDGAINTNVIELAKWDANFYDAKVGGRQLIDRLQQRGTLNTGDSLGYARGLFVDTYRGLRRVHHGGAWAGYRAMLMRFPDQGLAIGLTCNVGNAGTDARAVGVADVVLAGAFKEAKAGPKAGATAAGPVDPAPYVGLYFDESIQTAVEVVAEQGKAALKLMGGSLPLVPAGSDKFTAEGRSVAVDFVDGRQGLDIRLGTEKFGSFRRTARAAVTDADWKELAGSYTSPELGTTWTIRLEGGKALLKGRAVGEAPLEAVIKDGYQSGTGFLMFTRGADGRITGFDLSASRMKRIRFDR